MQDTSLGHIQYTQREGGREDVLTLAAKKRLSSPVSASILAGRSSSSGPKIRGPCNRISTILGILGDPVNRKWDVKEDPLPLPSPLCNSSSLSTSLQSVKHQTRPLYERNLLGNKIFNFNPFEFEAIQRGGEGFAGGQNFHQPAAPPLTN